MIMWIGLFKGMWAFLTSKLGLSLIATAALGYGVWCVYDAGAKSEIKNAQEIVAKGKEKADKAIADMQSKLTALEQEKEKWNADLDAAVSKAKDAQSSVLEGLKSKVAALEARGPIIKTVIKEVPKYVTQTADASCTVTDGFVWMYNYTLQADSVSGSGPANADAASGITISEVARTAGQNNDECVQRGAVIELWQEWYNKNKPLFDEMSKAANSR